MTIARDKDGLADLAKCAREPIHIIGHIQAHGLLFALSEPDLIIRQVSANVNELTGVAPHAILGKSLAAVLGGKQFETFQSRLRSDDLKPESALRVCVGNGGLSMNCIAHRYDGVLIVEFEVVNGTHTVTTSGLSANIQILLARMERASDIVQYAGIAAGELQRLSGFDRVMIYRFDADWNGEIIAEAGKVSKSGVSLQASFLGMRFPAGDIPVQARELFLVNSVRAIADLESAPVPIVPEIEPLTQRPLDLTLAFLRSPSPIHVEYLRNMGVLSSLTISIIVEERLWGLVACHHHAAQAIDCSTRALCEMIARHLALQVTLLQATAERESRSRAAALLEAYGDRMEVSDAEIDAETLRAAGFLDLFDADGLVSRLNGVVSSLGVTAAEESLLPALGKLRSLASRGIAGTDQLRTLDPDAESYMNESSGAMYIDLLKQTGDYLLFLRRELIATVIWAGDPDKAVCMDPTGELHPRRSFAAWQETVSGRARPWSTLDLENARALRAQLLYLRNARKLRELE